MSPRELLAKLFWLIPPIMRINVGFLPAVEDDLFRCQCCGRTGVPLESNALMRLTMVCALCLTLWADTGIQDLRLLRNMSLYVSSQPHGYLSEQKSPILSDDDDDDDRKLLDKKREPPKS